MADPSANPFATMGSAPGVAGAPVGNPFDIFGVPSADAQQSAASEAPRVASPSVSSQQSNPFAAMGTTLPIENLQIGEKPVHDPYFQQQQQPQPQQQQQQQPWQTQMTGNGQQAGSPQLQPQAIPQPRQEQAASPPPQQQYASAPSPFQPVAAVSPTPDQNPFAWSQSPASQPVPPPSVENPWNANVQPQPVQPAPTPFDSYAAAAPQPPAPYTQPGNPFFAPSGVPQGGASYSSAIIPSQQASNPYAGLVVPQQQQQVPQPSQAMVPAVQTSSQWSVGGPAPAPARSASFDPFAPPPPAPAPPPAPVLPPAPAPVPVAQPAPFYASNAMVPAASAGYPGAPNASPQGAPNALVPAPNAAYPGAMVPVDAAPRSYTTSPPVPTENQLVQRSEHSRSDASYGSGQGNDRRQMVPYKPEDRDHDAPNDRQLAVVPDDDVEKPKRNLFSEALSKNAPPGSAPLPKANLVVKSGFVLSRISFRTIVMKKWKQSYWVQYGPHTMLWFRSQADFDDWLNNPYHTPSQRNFLIKLAVNFVHDLYKPNVRGYQVTQARTKAYGREQIKQFKLERWMDYGPTIAAAFGSQDPKEVDNLRQALVECMRNTPLEGGVRATGAVRQDHDSRRRDSDDDEEDDDDDHDSNYAYDSERMAGATYDDIDRSQDRPDHSNEHQRKDPPSTSAPAPAPVGDLLDASFFDVPLGDQPPQQGPPVAAAPPNYAAAPQPNYGQQPVPPQGYGQPYPPQGGYAQPPSQYQQQPVYSQPSPQLHYYGFPPVPTQYQQQQQQQQQPPQAQQQQHY